MITGIFLASWQFRGYTLREKVNLWRGRAFSRRFGLWEQLLEADLRVTVPALEVPVYFLAGKYDYTTATSLAQEYFTQLHAPVKRFYVFEHSAHSALLEEPDSAHRILEHDILQQVTGGAMRDASPTEEVAG